MVKDGKEVPCEPKYETCDEVVDCFADPTDPSCALNTKSCNPGDPTCKPLLSCDPEDTVCLFGCEAYDIECLTGK